MSLGWRRAVEGHSAFGDLAERLRRKTNLILGRKVERIGKSGKNILALANWRGAVPPVSHASATKDHERRFFILCTRFKDIARLQTMYKETHPFPVRLRARQM